MAGRVLAGIFATLIMLPFETAFPFLFRSVNLFRSVTLEEAASRKASGDAAVAAARRLTRDDAIKVRHCRALVCTGRAARGASW